MMTYSEWRSCIIDHIRMIADATRQREAWTRSGPPMADWVELACILCDDLDVRGFLGCEPQDDSSREKQFRGALGHLADRIDAFCDSHADDFPAEEALRDPDWIVIQQMAALLVQMVGSDPG